MQLDHSRAHMFAVDALLQDDALRVWDGVQRLMRDANRTGCAGVECKSVANALDCEWNDKGATDHIEGQVIHSRSDRQSASCRKLELHLLTVDSQ